MTELQRFMLVADNNREEAFQIADETAKKLENKETTLIDVVQSLGEYINDEDAIIRGKAVSYLTAVLKALPPKFLSRQQIQVLATFYCDRIEDGGAISGLDSLQSLDRFNKEMAIMTVRALFQHASRLQARSQSQRFQTLQLLNGLMLNHRAALKELGDESLVGIVDLVSGERDPRNLMLIFSILRVIMVEWDISNHVQDLFDSVYNYFPITFRPPPNDPYGITAQDLKDRLQSCIASTPLFAPHAFPSLLDKLDSTSFNVKKDALNAIGACVDSYDPSTLTRYSLSIWDCLKFEILNAQDEVLAEESLRVLTALAKRLSELTHYASKQSPLSQFLKPITNECNEKLREPLQKQAKPARQIIKSLSGASAAAFTFVVQAVVGPLLTIYQDSDGVAKQRELLESLASVLESALAVYGKWNDRVAVQSSDNPLLLFKEQLTEMLSQVLMGSLTDEISFRTTALKGYLRLSALKNFLDDNEIGLFIQYLDEILLTTEDMGDALRKEAIAALAELSKYKSGLIIDITFPSLISALPDSDPGKDSGYIRILESLAKISTERDVFETLVRRLLSRLDLLLSAENTNAPVYSRAILMTIYYAMDRRGLDNDPNVEYYYNKLVCELCRRAALASKLETTTTPLHNDAVLDTLGRLCNLIVRSAQRQKQEEACTQVYSLYSTQDGFVPVPFASASGPYQRQTMILSTYLLAGLPKDSRNLPYTESDMGPLLKEIVRLALTEESATTQFALVRQLSLLVNKFLPTSALPMASEVLFSLISSATREQKFTPNTIRTIFWLSKALILRLAPTISDILTKLLELLASPNPETSTSSARGFSIILSNDDVLCTKNGANIRLLSKQRVFTYVVPLIATKVREFNIAISTSGPSLPSHAKQAYLTALAGILSTIPSSLVMPELPTLFPLLLQSLDLTGPESQPVKSGILDTLAIIIRENGARVIHEIGYVEDLVTRLLKTASAAPSKNVSAGAATTTNRNGNNPTVRSRALQCLHLLAQHPTAPGVELTVAEKAQASPLLRLKPNVLRSLGFILDDPKRDVRKAAVDARAAWLRRVEDGKGDETD
ncbi:hypothetical protein VTO42DRAFT_791 [Malbranchea cinnamomea]